MVYSEWDVGESFYNHKKQFTKEVSSILATFLVIKFLERDKEKVLEVNMKPREGKGEGYELGEDVS